MTPNALLPRRFQWTRILIPIGVSLATLIGLSLAVDGKALFPYTALSAIPSQVILAETLLFRALDTWILWLVSGIVTGISTASLLTAPAPHADSGTPIERPKVCASNTT